MRDADQFRRPDRSAPERRARFHARKAVETALEASAASYRRAEFLRAFHRLSAETIAAESPEASRLVLAELERALRGERARMHRWTYDLGRHIALIVAYRAERARAKNISMLAAARKNSKIALAP